MRTIVATLCALPLLTACSGETASGDAYCCVSEEAYSCATIDEASTCGLNQDASACTRDMSLDDNCTITIE